MACAVFFCASVRWRTKNALERPVAEGTPRAASAGRSLLERDVQRTSASSRQDDRAPARRSDRERRSPPSGPGRTSPCPPLHVRQRLTLAALTPNAEAARRRATAHAAVHRRKRPSSPTSMESGLPIPSPRYPPPVNTGIRLRRPWEFGGFCEARHGVGSVRDAGWRLTEAGLSEAAVGLALWVEYRGAPGATLIPGGDLTGVVAVGGSDPGCAGQAACGGSEVIDGAVIGG